MSTKTENHAEQQAKAQTDSIVDMIRALNKALEDRDNNAEETARDAIQEDPLSIQIRDGWRTPGGESTPEEFEILLCTGGPAVRIVGDLDSHCEPSRPRLQYQDWGTSWTEYHDISKEQREALLAYCQQFYFGE